MNDVKKIEIDDDVTTSVHIYKDGGINIYQAQDCAGLCFEDLEMVYFEARKIREQNSR